MVGLLDVNDAKRIQVLGVPTVRLYQMQLLLNSDKNRECVADADEELNSLAKRLRNQMFRAINADPDSGRLVKHAATEAAVQRERSANAQKEKLIQQKIWQEKIWREKAEMQQEFLARQRAVQEQEDLMKRHARNLTGSSSVGDEDEVTVIEGKLPTGVREVSPSTVNLDAYSLLLHDLLALKLSAGQITMMKAILEKHKVKILMSF